MMMMMMMKEETTATAKGGSNTWARVCDTCRSAASTVYCRADSAFLCDGCDARIHAAANRMASRHERVWLCESCERAPAAFICKADAASLCTSCDADIHSANPLARRHQRVPVLPIPGCVYGPPSRTVGLLVADEADESMDEEDEDEAASWLLINPSKNKNQNSAFLFGGEVDEYLDLVEYNPSAENHLIDHYNPHKLHQQQQCYSVPDQKNYGGDSVVPVQCVVAKEQMQRSFQPEMSYESPKAAYSYNPSISHSVSVSSMDVGIVPESTISDISTTQTHPRGPKGTVDIFTTIQVPAQLTPMDREARVLRYREKKKMRKFEKTIRYASRKAYAETRPRIKGRFAKRTTDAGFEVDQMFSTSLMVEKGYGVVPSF